MSLAPRVPSVPWLDLTWKISVCFLLLLGTSEVLLPRVLIGSGIPQTINCSHLTGRGVFGGARVLLTHVQLLLFNGIPG